MSTPDAPSRTDYYDESYVGIGELLARAHDYSARRVEVVDGVWQSTPVGDVYEAIAEVETADGRTVRRRGRARPGDAKVECPAAPQDDVDVENRAEKRALAAAIRTAYPDVELAEDEQPPHVRRVQALVRRAADALDVTRDQLAAVAHKRLGVASLNDLTPEQADEAEAWLTVFVEGD